MVLIRYCVPAILVITLAATLLQAAL